MYILHPNKPNDPENIPADYDGTMLEMAKEIEKKKSKIGYSIKLFEHLKDLQSIQLPEKLDFLLFAGHSLAHTFNEDDSLHFIPLKDRKIAGIELKKIIKFILTTLEIGVIKITFFCCQVGDCIITRNLVHSKGKRHVTQHVDVGFLYDMQNRLLEPSGNVSTLELIVLSIVISIYCGKNNCNQAVKLKAPIGFGFFHSTALTNGVCKFRSFEAEYYPTALRLMKDSSNRSNDRWDKFERDYVEGNLHPWSITFIVDPRRFNRSKICKNLMKSLISTTCTIFG